MKRGALVYFMDENAMGLAKKLLELGRDDVVHPGHPALPEVPRGSRDLDWMPVVARRGLLIVTRDRHIRTRPAELRAYLDQGLRSVWIGTKRDLRPDEQRDLFLRHEARLLREVVKRGDGPWALALGESGPRPLSLRDT